MAQINRDIELIRYKLFGDELLLFELVNGGSAASQQAYLAAPRLAYFHLRPRRTGERPAS